MDKIPNLKVRNSSIFLLTGAGVVKIKMPSFLRILYASFKLFWHLNSDVSLASLQYFFVFLFAIYGLIISLKKFSTISILYLLPVFFTIMSLIFWGDDRIRSPIEPIFVIFAAYGISQNFEWRKFTGH